MFSTSYRVILFALLSMNVAAALLFFDTAPTVAYVLLAIGFFGVGIGILIGFYMMVNEKQ